MPILLQKSSDMTDQQSLHTHNKRMHCLVSLKEIYVQFMKQKLGSSKATRGSKSQTITYRIFLN